ncbi:uncharacterized protein LOC131849692 [Achroia grisella]|uniref:uncharacterized protein LOC131849692 n=1 Tax=Achroia grisella TaxID=688607 RepID=UPI0027D31B6E|nr:uncharacterized protein LOC131849692 [Achroia grisella]
MVVRTTLSLILFQIITTAALRHEKPVAQLIWQGRCTRNKYALNDCNWCTCNEKHQYTCKARVCDEVDMFGHFNDAIRDINVGMEGHGTWRSSESPCEPGVHYQRKDLLCVCDEEGNWPNPVCRDIFRILHPVEVIEAFETKHQSCSPTKLYLIGCNVCFCPSKGKIDTDMCTKRECVHNDPVIIARDENNAERKENDIIDNYDIYAQCRPDHKYKLGCKTCICLRNNRLHCNNCTSNEQAVEAVQSYCSNIKKGHLFSRDCNLCYCDKNGHSYCTVKKCLKSKNMYYKEFNEPFNEENCIPGNVYKKDCNTCSCVERDGKKTFGCSLKFCARTRSTNELMHFDCVENTVYELNCLICSCEVVNGTKKQLCEVNPKCNDVTRNANDLDELHGYCEPLHNYKKDCNDCRCLSDGKTVICTSRICAKRSQKPIRVDIVPVTQKGEHCPIGHSYKIDCNYCFCLSNGNAVCTTIGCKK